MGDGRGSCRKPAWSCRKSSAETSPSPPQQPEPTDCHDSMYTAYASASKKAASTPARQPCNRTQTDKAYPSPPPSTVRRILHRHGLITPTTTQTAQKLLHSLRRRTTQANARNQTPPTGPSPTAPTSRPATIADMQQLLDEFTVIYNTARTQRALPPATNSSPTTPSTPTATTGATNKKTPADGRGLP